ncbi:MAG: TonB-dependent receptor domain-containing protein [Bacteroidia bacterium]
MSGKITDKKTNEPLAGAVVYLHDLKTGAVSSIDGSYQIKNLPKGKFLVEIRYTTFKTISSIVDIIGNTTKDFQLEESIAELHEVVVTGTSRASDIKRNPVSIVTIDSKQMEQNISTNAIDAIAKLPGVSAVTTGPNISKPFIRGLGYNRILTLYDGQRQEGNQWGDEHGIEVDEYAIDKVEVVKGPASLIYGSDALAGVVNLLPANPLPNGIIRGSFLTNYQTNNGLIGLSAALAGNNNGLLWSGRISHKQAMDYQNAIDGRVYGTNYNEYDASGMIGVTRKWGYSHINFSMYDLLQSIPDGSRDSLTRKFTKQISEADTLRPIVSDNELNTYTIPTLHQHVQHYRIYWANNIYFGQSKLAVNLGYQENVRREFSHPANGDLAGLYLDLKTLSYDFKYYLPDYFGLETTVGVNGMYQTNKNIGTEFIIPDYTLFDFGPFLFVKKSFEKLDVSAGARYDVRYFSNTEMYTAPNVIGIDTVGDRQVASTVSGANQVFQNYNHTFSGFSGSIGAAYNINENFIFKMNVARGFRAPNISEISANGVHPGTLLYQIGNPNFLPEFSLQEDIGILFSSLHVSGGVEIFNNNISNYIYNEKVLNSKGQDSVIVAGNQTFQYKQADAHLYGFEADLDIHPHPLDWLHFENSISMVYAINNGATNDSSKFLPFIPPLHTRSELRADVKKKFKNFSSLFVKTEMEYFAAQNRAFLAYNTETTTPGYILFNAGFGGEIINDKGKAIARLSLLCNNIFDVAYQSNMSRLKYMEQYSASPNGHLGIYNMGRNFSVKVVIPINIR